MGGISPLGQKRDSLAKAWGCLPCPLFLQQSLIFALPENATVIHPWEPWPQIPATTINLLPPPAACILDLCLPPWVPDPPRAAPFHPRDAARLVRPSREQLRLLAPGSLRKPPGSLRGPELGTHQTLASQHLTSCGPHPTPLFLILPPTEESGSPQALQLQVEDGVSPRTASQPREASHRRMPGAQG